MVRTLALRGGIRSWVGVHVHNNPWWTGGLRYFNAESDKSPPKRIAIVGAGIGGTAAAYFLRQQFGKCAQIDIFENGKVGGRLATTTVEGNEYEVGGTVIHPRNLHMKDFIRQLGLKERQVNIGRVGIYNGEKFTFEESSSFLINVLKLQWRYGFNLIRLKIWLNGILEKFSRIYHYQHQEYAFTTVEELLHALGGDEFISMTQATVEEVLLKAGYSQKFMDEMVTPVMRINYGQNKNVSAFVGAVSLAGAQPNLWAVEGGNWLVCQGLINAASAELVQGRVTAVECQSPPSRAEKTFSSYKLDIEKSDFSYSVYDIVVLAAPLHKNMANISFQNFSHPVGDFSGKYHQTVATVVYGLLNVPFFSYKNLNEFTLNEILTTENPKLFISSVGALSPLNVSVDCKVKVTEPAAWKVFSPEPLTQEQLDLLFASYSSKSERTWLAYPHYAPPEIFPPIILHDNMYYLNSIEWAASAMEMSAIAARNIALLAHHRWYQKTDKIDQENLKA
ncbi:prenylcysteine oxidase-like [Protopterus annectens]|uniref:prenylcysteine oxidase-like n=1 Tax=Protopterus annectens TaxID=7888 RepID=UPI001CFC213C|nr:prenylcysteine oxidase-like [Protopterus annectens]